MSEQLADLFGTGGVGEPLAAGRIGEFFSEFGKDLQMLFCGLFGNEQDEKERNRSSIRRVKRDRRSKT